MGVFWIYEKPSDMYVNDSDHVYSNVRVFVWGGVLPEEMGYGIWLALNYVVFLVNIE